MREQDASHRLARRRSYVGAATPEADVLQACLPREQLLPGASVLRGDLGRPTAGDVVTEFGAHRRYSYLDDSATRFGKTATRPDGERGFTDSRRLVRACGKNDSDDGVAPVGVAPAPHLLRCEGAGPHRNRPR
jgi:hypothetical protein